MNPMTSLNMLEDVLARIEKEHAAQPVWIVGRDTGRLLRFLVRVVQPLCVLEIGTSVGYSGLWMASGLEMNGQGELWTIESHAERYGRAQQNFAEAGLAHRIHSVKGHAPEIFEELSFPQGIDFAFFDATKMEHASYLEVVLPLLNSGAMLAVDNVGSHRGVMESFVDALKNDPCFEVVELTVGSGLLLARRA